MSGQKLSVRQLALRFHGWLPGEIDRRIRVVAWLSLLTQIAIIGTGGAVRLTGSGLGCPTWPYCTADSLIPTAEMGVHGAIEFGNRLMSILVGIIAVAMVVLLLRIRRERPDLFQLAIALVAGTVLQGFIGGISVRVNLDPSVVGVHFGISVILVVLATALVFRIRYGLRGETLAVPRWFSALVHTTMLFVSVTIVVGILTTGSGPHAGDSATDRNGLNPELLQHVHSWPAYVTLALTVVMLVAAVRLHAPRLVRFAALLLAVELIQTIVGVVQSRLGLPELLVGIHMVLACVLASAATAVVLSLRKPRHAGNPVTAETLSLRKQRR